MDRIKPSIDSSGVISFRSSLVEQGIDLNELLGSRRLASIEGTDLQLSRRHLQPGTITETVQSVSKRKKESRVESTIVDADFFDAEIMGAITCEPKSGCHRRYL